MYHVLGFLIDCCFGSGLRIQLINREYNTPTPDLSIEVDDVDAAFERMKRAGFPMEYGPVVEPWGVRRFYVRDHLASLSTFLLMNIHRQTVNHIGTLVRLANGEVISAFERSGVPFTPNTPLHTYTTWKIGGRS
jgi:catechol 2,3-dioxygenase-like lactoylglutathione lyase family enzyme